MQLLGSLSRPTQFCLLSLPWFHSNAYVNFERIVLSFLARNTQMKPTITPFSSILFSCSSLLFLFLFPFLSNGRDQPWLSPPPAPLLTSQVKMISASPSATEVAVEVKDRNLDKGLIVAISLTSFCIILITLSIIFAWFFRPMDCGHQNSNEIQRHDSATKGLSWAPVFRKFDSLKTVRCKGLAAMIEYSSLESATDNFNENNVLGKGEMGYVYKACFDGGVLSAVKKLDGIGQDYGKMLDNELDLLRKIRHPNVVPLLGYCIHGESRFLVYELMQNGSLEMQLHGPSHGSALTWHMRMKIAVDAARGLEYLHERCHPPIIHRDVKSSNILLDSNFNAKISDFRVAITGGTKNKASVKFSGTLGYVAPEYVLDGNLTEKSDIYAFGVVLLELLLGRSPVEIMESECQSIVTWAMPQLTDRSKLPSFVDRVIQNTMDPIHLYQVAAVAVLCVQPEPSYRPLITDVLHSLMPLVPVELGGAL